MPKKHTKQDFVPQIDSSKAQGCGVYGCKHDGLYKAPKSKNELGEYLWLCLDHISEYNASWDYFDGMNRDQIEHFMKDAMTGHRPTWERHSGGKRTTEDLHHALNDFMHMNKKRRPNLPPSLPRKIIKALAIIDLEYPYTLKTLKTEYRKLVKKHHPDRHQGNKKAEDTFKRISEAYDCLRKHIQT